MTTKCSDCGGTGIKAGQTFGECWGCDGYGTEAMRLDRAARAAKQGGAVQASPAEIARVEAHASSHADRAERAASLHTSIAPAIPAAETVVTEAATLTASIRTMVEGRCKASRTDSVFASVALRGGKYVVECGWRVPESIDDDYMSSTHHPFADRRPCPWVGRRLETDDAAIAAEAYTAYKDAVYSRQVPARGDKIGSVSR